MQLALRCIVFAWFCMFGIPVHAIIGQDHETLRDVLARKTPGMGSPPQKGEVTGAVISVDGFKDNRSFRHYTIVMMKTDTQFAYLVCFADGSPAIVVNPQLGAQLNPTNGQLVVATRVAALFALSSDGTGVQLGVGVGRTPRLDFDVDSILKLFADAPAVSYDPFTLQLNAQMATASAAMRWTSTGREIHAQTIVYETQKLRISIDNMPPQAIAQFDLLGLTQEKLVQNGVRLQVVESKEFRPAVPETDGPFGPGSRAPDDVREQSLKFWRALHRVPEPGSPEREQTESPSTKQARD